MEEATEIYFLMSGQVTIGFKINQKEVQVLMSSYLFIGGFEVTFNKRS